MSVQPALRIDEPEEGPGLGRYDLNLLVVLTALLRRRNITHAGRDVRLSQPAASRALTRLRAVYGNDLLVKRDRSFELTGLGQFLLPKLDFTLEGIDRILGPYMPAPERFTVAMPDHQALTLSGHLSRYFREISPSTVFLPLTSLAQSMNHLENGQVDLVLGNAEDAPAGFFRRALPPFAAVGLCRQGHPACRGRFAHGDLGRFLSIRIGSGYQAGFGEVHDGLEALRPRGRETLTVPDIHTAASLLLDTDGVLVLPERTATYLASRYGLATFALRGRKLPEYQIGLLWHERSHRDGIHAGVRSVVASMMLEGCSRPD
ncbi:LysR family transcriptional regulator [Poseidonocella sp. HB161398]|uniref:LysR family transcriptional regulator n=1 Tax=Poseidonocella sp. HB161398 TaxID=2320855 RepID=UPI0011084006|nr:LysR family transcriptional regulator [Poseidonocella sp. HB161398]